LEKNKMLFKFFSVFLLVFFIFGNLVGICFSASVSAGTIERSQEILKEDKTLRQRIEENEKFFIKKVTLKGISKISEEEVQEIIVPFQGQWMTKDDIQQLIDLVKSAYAKKGVKTDKLNVNYEIKERNLLEITFSE